MLPNHPLVLRHSALDGEVKFWLVITDLVSIGATWLISYDPSILVSVPQGEGAEEPAAYLCIYMSRDSMTNPSRLLPLEHVGNIIDGWRA